MSRALRSNRVLQIGSVVALVLITGLVVGHAATAGSPAPAGDSRPVAAFIGDADVQGVGATASDARWSSIVAKAEGWREVDFGRAATGYATSSKAGSCGHQICPAFGDMVDQVAAIDPQVVVVAGGQSDWLSWTADVDRTSRSIDALFSALQQRLPAARIIVVGPLQPPGAEHEHVVEEIAARVQEAAAAQKLTYVDLLDPNVLRRGEDVAANRFSANDAGHRAIAARVLKDLK